jgi:hypothetical protein
MQFTIEWNRRTVSLRDRSSRSALHFVFFVQYSEIDKVLSAYLLRRQWQLDLRMEASPGYAI